MTDQNQDQDDLAHEVGVQIDRVREPRWWGKGFRKVWARAHWLLPNKVPHPYGNDREYEREHDRKENAETRVPEGESLENLVVWGVELYGPNDADELYRRLDALDWRAGSGLSSRGNAASWVREQRGYGFGGGWCNIGQVVSKTAASRNFMQRNFAQLPDGVDRLLVRIFQLTPSLTCLVVGFVLKESRVGDFQVILAKDQSTYHERGERWSIRIIDPREAKRRMVELERRRLRKMIEDWFASTIPGYFSKIGKGRMLTAELLVMNASSVLKDDAELRSGGWIDWWGVVASPRPGSVWRHVKHDAIRFALDGHGDREGPSHLIVSLNASEINEDDLKNSGGFTRNGYVWYCHEIMDGVFANHAAIVFLREVSRDLKYFRETVSLGSTSRKKALTTLDGMQAFFDKTIGLPSVAEDLKERSTKRWILERECSGFSKPSIFEEDKIDELAADLQSQSSYYAELVAKDEKATRDHFSQLSNIVSARESIRAQQSTEFLTRLAVLFAAVSFMMALLAIMR